MRSEEPLDTDQRAGTVTISKGLVRIDDDRDSDLRVELHVSGGKLSMTSKMAEVGTWPLSSVTISRAGSNRFIISIEGETITYLPDDPNAFGAHEIVPKRRKKGGLRAKRRREKRGNPRVKAQTESAPKEAVTPQADPVATLSETGPVSTERDDEPETTPEEEPQRGARRRAAQAERAQARRAARAKQAEKRSAARIERREKRAAARVEREEQRKAARTKRAEDRSAAKARLAKGREVRRQLWADRGHPLRDRLAATVSSLSARAARQGRIALIRGRWRARLALYWAMDELRQIEGWPFNRIPHVDDEKRREPGHVHSFKASAAPAGIIREVCACGKIRLTSNPIELEGPSRLRNEE